LPSFITFTCYGTWLHGDVGGSVDIEHNAPGTAVLPPDPERHAREENDLSEPPYQLDRRRRQVALAALREIARRKGWTLHAAHVRSNHIHVVVTAVQPCLTNVRSKTWRVGSSSSTIRKCAPCLPTW
jgi:hypothetical protein